MAGLIKEASSRAGGLKKAGDAKRDPAQLNVAPASQADEAENANSRPPAATAEESRPAVNSDQNGQPATPDESKDAGGRVLLIPLDQLTPNPRNRRDNDKLLTDKKTIELAESMKWLGQLQPAKVVPTAVYVHHYPEFKDKIETPWVVLYGNRRRAAALLNESDHLECIERSEINDDHDKFEVAPIHENVFRVDINPLEMAYWLSEQRDRLGSQEKVAKFVMRSQPWVSQLLGLLNMIPELQVYLKGDEFEAATGRQLAALAQDKQRQIWHAVQAMTDEDRAAFWRAGPPFKVDSQSESKSSNSSGDSKSSMMVIRLTNPTPQNLAEALRKKLSSEQVQELISQLQDED